MSGEMIAILAVGVALVGVILTSLRGLRHDCGRTWRNWNRGWKRNSTPCTGSLRNCGPRLRNCASAWRTWKDCWKD